MQCVELSKLDPEAQKKLYPERKKISNLSMVEKCLYKYDLRTVQIPMKSKVAKAIVKPARKHAMNHFDMFYTSNSLQLITKCTMANVRIH